MSRRACRGGSDRQADLFAEESEPLGRCDDFRFGVLQLFIQRCLPSFLCLGGGCGADEAGHEALGCSAAAVAAYFDAVYLGVVHPGAQELDDRGQLVWDNVCDEYQPNDAAAQIAFRPVPQVLRITNLAAHLLQHGCRVPADASAGSLEQLCQRALPPVPGAVCSVVEHLPNDLTADPAIRCPLYLPQG